MNTNQPSDLQRPDDAARGRSSPREVGKVAAAQVVRPLYLGVDVGGTNIKIGLVDDQGQVLGKSSLPTWADRSPEETLPRVARQVAELLGAGEFAASDLVAVGLGTPGTMDIPAGRLLDPPNLPGWHFYPIRQRLSETLQRPVWFANDANAAAFGECWMGSGRQFHSIVFLTLGTGVGGGIIIGDLSVDGENSCGSECGHITIDYHDHARMCNCGQTGHLEAYASATALVRRAHEALAQHSTREHFEHNPGDSQLARHVAAGDKVTPLLISQLAEGGDGFCRDLVLNTARYLGIGITSLMHTIDPGAVILGGAMNFGGHDSPLGREFLERIRAEVRRRAFPILAEKTTIDFAALGSAAGFIGAAGIARAGFRKSN